MTPPSTTTTSTTVPLLSSFQASRAISFPRYRLSFSYFIALGIAAAAITLLLNLLHSLFLSPLLLYPTLSYAALVMQLHQLALRPCQPAMLSYRAAITLGSERGKFILLQLHQTQDKLKSR